MYKNYNSKFVKRAISSLIWYPLVSPTCSFPSDTGTWRDRYGIDFISTSWGEFLQARRLASFRVTSGYGLKNIGEFRLLFLPPNDGSFSLHDVAKKILFLRHDSEEYSSHKIAFERFPIQWQSFLMDLFNTVMKEACPSSTARKFFISRCLVEVSFWSISS